MSELTFTVVGIDKLQAKLGQFPRQIQSYLGHAALESADIVLKTRGIQRYPPGWAANVPPTPYYIRGRGTQTASGNLNNSERYGTQWEVSGVPYGVRVSNPVSYAKYLAGRQQVSWAGSVGWRKLADVAREKTELIRRKYQAWVNKCIKDLGL